MLSARRVLARYLQADAVGDPKALLAQFEAGVSTFARAEPHSNDLHRLIGELEKAQNDPAAFAVLRGEWNKAREPVQIKILIERSFDVLAASGRRLFLAILQLLALPPNLTKKVQAAARYWSKSKIVLRKDTRPWTRYLSFIEAVEAYPTLLSTFREHVAVATECLAKGKSHAEGEETRLKAGPFTLVNTGNFKPDAMKAVAEAVEKAAKAMTSAGFGKVCYGDILVTNTITSRGNVLAFYMIANDEMFVRANAKANADTVETICHELAHRLQHKFLSGKKREIDGMYDIIARYAASSERELEYPEKGKQVEHDGSTLTVVDVRPYKGQVVFTDSKKDAKDRFVAPVTLWYKRFERKELADFPNYKGFVSEYAKSGGSGENFAEMVAYYALGKLPAAQVKLLESVIK